MVFRKGLFYVLLGTAIAGLSEFLAAWRMWRTAPGMQHAVQVAVLGCGLLIVGLWLGFLLYEVDRAAGRVRRPIRLYEWILARRVAGSRPGLRRGPLGGGPPAAVSPGRGRG
ncbi:MAG TPA: hypothetical protein VFP86_00415 [bacterium]|nr:hypothetical protein [bacterium]